MVILAIAAIVVTPGILATVATLAIAVILVILV